MFTDAWTRIGEKTGAAPGFLHHTRKQSSDGKLGDPFDTLRGSGDFGATARNIIIALPMPTVQGLPPRSEVRMRGNLDLRRDGFVSEFDRRHVDGRWQTRLVDRGAIEGVREVHAASKKEQREADKKSALLAERDRRRQRALDMCRRKGNVTAGELAVEFGLSSDRSMAPILTSLVDDKLLVPAGKRGYELPGTSHQEGLL